MDMLDRVGMSRTDAGLQWYWHILPYGFALHFLFGSVSIINALELGFFYYFPRRIQITIIDARIDMLAWTMSLVCVSVLAIWLLKERRNRIVQAAVALLTIVLTTALLLSLTDTFLFKTMLYALFAVGTANFAFLARPSSFVHAELSGTLVSRTLCYLLVILAGIEISSGTHYFLRSFDRTILLGKVDADIELHFSYLSYGLLPYLYLGFLFSWAWVPLVRKFMPKKWIFGSSSGAGTFSTYTAQMSVGSSGGGSRFSALLDPKLFATLAVVVFIGYYPYFQNPPWVVGTDAYWRYLDPLLRMNAQGLADGFAQALKERHPLPLALLYAVQVMFHTTAFEVVRLTPLFLVAALALATWWFLTRRKETWFGLMVILFSVLSVATTVGMFASILANWMALVVWMFFFAYTTYRAEKRIRLLDAIVLLSMSTLILLIHPWTWGVFAASVLLFIVITLFGERRKGLTTAAVLLSVVVVDVVFALVSLTLLAGTEGWRVAQSLKLYTTVLRDPASLLVFWDVLNRLTHVWAVFFSPLSLAVSIFGVFYLCGGNIAARRRLVLAWICASAIGSLLVAPVGYDPSEPTRSQSELWRLLFLAPLQLTMPFGVALISEIPKGLRTENRNPKNESRGGAVRGWVLASLFAVGILLVLAPVEWRTGLILFVLPVISAVALAKCGGQEKEFLGDVVLVFLTLVAFNYTTRSLAQLLFDPHNYRPAE